MKPNLSINIGKLKLKNPIIVASGTFGYAEEFKDFFDLKKLGAIVSKTITLNPRKGNTPPRTCETPAGILNSIGLENPGLEIFLKEKLPILKKAGVPIIISIASEKGSQEFAVLAEQIDKIKGIAAIELNISCPNVSGGFGRRRPNHGLAAGRSKLISQDARTTYETVKTIRKITKKILITKLSPNVTDITEIALAAQKAGSDAVSLINTLTGMAIDIKSRSPKLGALTGGLSGPAIRPIAVRMVWEVYQKIKIPIIGMGGIMEASNALEFLLAGATAVAIGTANFINPRVSIEIIEGIKKYVLKNEIRGLKNLTGSLKI